MNTQRSKERRQRRLAELAHKKPFKRKRHVHMTTTDDFALSDVAPVMSDITQKFPNPWLVDSEFLLNELARLRELILRVPIHNNALLPIQTAVDSIWRLEEQLHYLLHLHREGQRSFAQKTAKPEPRNIYITESKVAGIKA